MADSSLAGLTPERTPQSASPSLSPAPSSPASPPRSSSWRTRSTSFLARERDALIKVQPSLTTLKISKTIDPLEQATQDVMSRSTDPDHFFQSHDSDVERIRKKKKSKNENGNPIRLQSKILAVIADPTDNGAVYIAQSDGRAGRIVLGTRITSHVYTGPAAPITSLALTPSCTTLFAGCWDKTIWSWANSTRLPSHRYKGHTDFVKSLLCLNIKGIDILISGSADACIIIWNVSTGERIHNLKGGHTRGILDLAVDPASLFDASHPSVEDDTMDTSEGNNEGVGAKESGILIFSAGSDRSIRRWRISTTVSNDDHTFPASELNTNNPIFVHETSVFHLCFNPEDDDELWTASADGTVKCVSRNRNWREDTTLDHGDYVDAVVVNNKWVVSAGRNEDVKVWDRTTGDLRCVYSGHFEEITGLVLLGQTIVSAGIDATIRQWSLKPDDMSLVMEKRGRGELGYENIDDDARRLTDSDFAEEDEELEALNREMEAEG